MFESIPTCLLQQQTGEASRISSIDISSNMIEELPRDLTKLKNLKVLKCSKNRMIKLTNELEKYMRERKI